jgi:DNA-binding transcriptional LysR family regulator
MHTAHIQSLDLNLLKVFDALLQEGSVSRAGLRLGLTQSAVSHALGRLRQALGDELFRRGAAGMQPTARALEIGPAVHAALRQVEAALAPPRFDPATAERRFSVICGAYICAVLVPTAAALLRARAPKSVLRIMSFAEDAIDSLEIGRADVVIGSFEDASERFVYRPLFNESLVWVVRHDHPLAMADEAPTLEALATAEHVVVEYPRPDVSPPEDPRLKRRSPLQDRGEFEHELSRRGLARRVAVVAPDSYTALAVVSRSHMAALVPRRLAERAALHRLLKILDPPYESPSNTVGVLSMRSRAGDPAQTWFIEQLAEAAKDL